MKKTTKLILDSILASVLFISALFGVSLLSNTKTASAEVVFDGKTLEENNRNQAFLTETTISTEDNSIYEIVFYYRHLGYASSSTTFYIELIDGANDYVIEEGETVTVAGKNYIKISPYENIVDEGYMEDGNSSAPYWITKITAKTTASGVFQKIQLRAIFATTYCDSVKTSLYEQWSTIDDLQAYGFSANASYTIGTYLASEQSGFREKVKAVIDNFVVFNGGVFYRNDLENKIFRFKNGFEVNVNANGKDLNFFMQNYNGYIEYESDPVFTESQWQDIFNSINLVKINEYYYLNFSDATPFLNTIGSGFKVSFADAYESAMANLPLTDDYTDELEQSNEDLREERLELLERIAELEDSLSEYEKELLKLGTEKKQLEEAYNQKVEELRNINIYLDEVIAERDALVESLEKQIAEKEEIIANNENNIQELMKVIEELSKELKNYKDALDGNTTALLNNIREKENKIAELEKELQEAQEELEKAKNQTPKEDERIFAGCNAKLSENNGTLIMTLCVLVCAIVVAFSVGRK